MFRFHKITAQIAKRFGPRVANTWLDAVGRFQGSIDTNALRRALAAGNIRSIEAVVRPTNFAAMLKDLEDPFAATAGAAGGASAQTLNAAGFPAQFNATHPNVILFARDQTADLVVGATRDVKTAIRTVVAIGAQQGLTTAQQARAIREVIALPPNWVSAPLRLGDEIRTGKVAAATRRRLSGVDKQQIRSRIQRGTVNETFISKMQKRYAQRLVNRRARNIARTETLRSANFGVNDSWGQAVQQGALPADSRRFWIVTPDDRLSMEHAEIPSLNPEGRKMDEPFETPDGQFMYPPSRPNCRCGIGLGIGTGSTTDMSLPSQPAPLTGRSMMRLPSFLDLTASQSVQVAREAGVKLTTRGASATLRQRQTAAVMAQGAKDVKAVGFDLSKLNIHMKGSSKIDDSVFNPVPKGKGVEITLRNRSGAEWAKEAKRNRIGSPPWSTSDDIAGQAHHELGHALHHDAVGTKRWVRLGDIDAWDDFGGYDPDLLAKVSKFADMSGPSEFVSEVFSGLMSGKRYADDVLQMYVKLDGPVASSWRTMFDRALVKVGKPLPPPPVAPPPPSPPGSVPVTVSGGEMPKYIVNPTRTFAQFQDDVAVTGARLEEFTAFNTAVEKQTVAMVVQAAQDVHKLGFDLNKIFVTASKEMHGFGSSTTGLYTPSSRTAMLRVQSVPLVRRQIVRAFESKWHSSDSWMRVMQHEFGHALQHKGMSTAAYRLNRRWPRPSVQARIKAEKPLLGSGRGPRIAGEVSEYATMDAHEFVAETFQGLVAGRRFSDDVMRLYVELKGPISPQWQARFDALKRAAVTKKVVKKVAKRVAVPRRQRKAATVTKRKAVKKKVVPPLQGKEVITYLDEVQKGIAEKFTVLERAAVHEYKEGNFVALNQLVRKYNGDVKKMVRGQVRELNRIRAGVGAPPFTKAEIDDLFAAAARKAADTVAGLDAALAKSPRIGRSIEVWRGVEGTQLTNTVNATEARRALEKLVGGSITDPGWASTTVSRRVAEKFLGTPSKETMPVLFRIQVVEEQRALWLSAVEKGHRAELELLFPRNTRFTVRKITIDDDGRVILDLIAIPGG